MEVTLDRRSVLVIRVWSEREGLRARITCAGEEGSPARTVAVAGPKDILSAVENWLRDLEPGP